MASFLSILLFMLVPVQSDSGSAIESRSRQQLQQYTEAIRQNRDAELNAWALAKVSHSSPALRSYTVSHLNKKEYSQPAFGVLKDTSLSYTQQIHKLSFIEQSPVLLVEYLLTEGDEDKKRAAARQFRQEVGFPASGEVNYPALVQALLDQSSITEDILPANRFHPLHFFLFYDKSIIRGGLISKDYLKTVGNSWSFYADRSLKQSLGLATLYWAFYEQYKYAETEDLYRSIIEDAVFPHSNLRLTILRSLDYSMYRLGYYNRSLNIVRNYSLPLAQTLDNKETALKIRIAEGAYLYRIGRIDQSVQVYQTVQRRAEEKGISFSQGRVLNNLAINFWKKGEFSRYLNMQFRALKEAQKENDYNTQINATKNLFIHYRINKDYNSARQYLTQAQELAQQEQNNSDLAQLAYYEGQLYRDAESDTDRAIASFNEALELISLDGNYRSYQNILSEKAILLGKHKRYGQGRAIFDQVLTNARQRNDRRNILYASFNKANTYMQTGRLDKAETILDTLNIETLDALDFYQLVKAKTVQARYLQRTDQQEKASETIQPAIEQIVSRSRGSGDLESGFWQIEPEYLDAFELYANLLINNDQQEEAVEALDRLKTINDAALYQNPLIRSKVLNERELSEYKRLTDSLDDLRKNLLASSGERQKEIQQKIDEKSANKNTYDRRITSRANEDPVSVSYIQSRMDAYHRVLHITALNDTYYLAIISRTDVEFKKIPITEELRSTFEQSIKEMAESTTDLENLYTITQFLGINRLPSHVDKLTIIPDSYLYQIPLDVLPLNAPANPYSYGGATYLIEKFETGYMTSLNDFKQNSKQQNYSYDYAGYGISSFDDDREGLVPLPEAETEITMIANRLTKLQNKRTFLNSNATEQAFRNNASRSRILHLATHSEVSSQDPMFSSFYLNRSEEDDQNRFPGRIFAYELFELNLANELIMLNSCESGSGSYLQGTGVVGISRALRYAGAESLVLNIWSVNDMMASDFAIKFYDGINNGLSKADAMRQAKLHFLQTKNANPHYWGSYMLLGNEKPIVEPNRWANNVVAASFFLFFFSIATASSILEFRRRRERAS